MVHLGSSRIAANVANVPRSKVSQQFDCTLHWIGFAESHIIKCQWLTFMRCQRVPRILSKWAANLMAIQSNAMKKVNFGHFKVLVTYLARIYSKIEFKTIFFFKPFTLYISEVDTPLIKAQRPSNNSLPIYGLQPDRRDLSDDDFSGKSILVRCSVPNGTMNGCLRSCSHSSLSTAALQPCEAEVKPKRILVRIRDSFRESIGCKVRDWNFWKDLWLDEIIVIPCYFSPLL